MSTKSRQAKKQRRLERRMERELARDILLACDMIGKELGAAFSSFASTFSNTVPKAITYQDLVEAIKMLPPPPKSDYLFDFRAHATRRFIDLQLYGKSLLYKPDLSLLRDFVATPTFLFPRNIG